MNSCLRNSLLLMMGLCAFVGADIASSARAGEQSRGPFSAGDETPQRMCVGMVKDDALIGFERTRKIRTYDREEYNALTWFRGDVRSGRITPAEFQTSSIVGQTTTILRRWYWEQGRLWLAFEAVYGSFGPCDTSLWRSKAPTERDGESAILDMPVDVAPLPKQKVLTQACKQVVKPFGAGEEVERLSILQPLLMRVDQIDVNCVRNDGRSMFYHGNDGFDFIPHGLDHWSLFMTVGHTMRIWDCRSKRVATQDGEQIRNTWTLVTEFWVPWTGQFFVFQWDRYDYLIVRDCGEVYELRLHYLDREAWAREPGPDALERWHGRQLLDSVDYLIALIYIEPENTVYGFGPNFYVRLAKGEPHGPLTASRLEKKACRDVTKGEAIWIDEDGVTHELGEPFRTVWQCAKVLKEDGVLDDLDDAAHGVEGE